MSDYLKFGGTVMNTGLNSLTLGELLSLKRKSTVTSAVLQLQQTLTHMTMITKPAIPIRIMVKGVNFNRV